MSDLFTLWLHSLGVSSLFRQQSDANSRAPTMAAQIPAAQDKQHFLAQGLKLYNPLSIGALGVALMTGAFNLTSYKAMFGRRFFELLGGVLGFKLVLVFLLINVSAAVSLGMGHRIVRTELRGEALAPERLTSLVKRIQIFTVVALLLTAWIVWVSLNLTRIARIPA